MQPDLTVQPMLPEHWDAVRAIYLEGIATGDATFETAAPEWEAWDRGHLPACRLVALGAGVVVGWVALSPVSRRPVYAGVAEVSLYVAERARQGRRPDTHGRPCQSVGTRRDLDPSGEHLPGEHRQH